VLLSRSFLAAFVLCLSSASAQQPAEILVAAAADLARIQPHISASFAKTTRCQARFSLGASGMLARQIANGAPFDVYLSANEKFTRDLEAAGKLAPGSVRVYAQGRLALWSRSERIRTLQDLLAPEVRHVAIANPLHAPYGVAAQQALKNQGLWEKLAGKIVYGENVQQALNFAETGNADAVLTAWSLVFDRGGILIPAAWHAPIRQVGAVVKSTRHPEAALAFLDFLTGPEGRQLLGRFGFEPPQKETRRPSGVATTLSHPARTRFFCGRTPPR
jgi:molybdate transport system substrate-binding protein